MSELRPPSIRRATRGDVDRLVAMLVRAFDDDPVANFVFGSAPGNRRVALTRFFGIQLRRGYLDDGEVWTTAGLDAVAVWGPPGKPRPGWRDVAALLPVFPGIVRGGRARDAIRLLSGSEQERPHEPHWYLATLGTEPARQGQGMGSALLRRALFEVDAQGTGAYLECSKERNVALYHRFGFEVVGELQGAGGGPKLWLMWRRPSAPDELG